MFAGDFHVTHSASVYNTLHVDHVMKYDQGYSFHSFTPVYRQTICRFK